MQIVTTTPNAAFDKRCKAVVIGGSAGGMDGLKAIFSILPSAYPFPVLVVQHLHPRGQRGVFRPFSAHYQPARDRTV